MGIRTYTSWHPGVSGLAFYEHNMSACSIGQFFVCKQARGGKASNRSISEFSFPFLSRYRQKVNATCIFPFNNVLHLHSSPLIITFLKLFVQEVASSFDLPTASASASLPSRWPSGFASTSAGAPPLPPGNLEPRFFTFFAFFSGAGGGG